MTRPYISVDNAPPISDPEWAAWVATNKLSHCYRLEALDDSLTQWVGSFYRTGMDGRPYVARGEVARRERAVTTTPARPEWVHL